MSPPAHKTTLAFLGTGTVGSALARLLAAQGYPIVTVYNRSACSCHHLAGQVGAHLAARPEDATRDANLVFITTPDDAIAPPCCCCDDL